MNGTLVAFGLVITELATFQAGKRVLKQFSAICTQFPAAMLFPAPQLYHVPDGSFLPIYSTHTKTPHIFVPPTLLLH